MSKSVPGTPYVHHPPRRLAVTYASFSDFAARTASWLSKLRLLVETEEEIPLGSTLVVEMRIRDGAVLIRALGEVGATDASATEGGEKSGVTVEVRYLDPASARLIDSVLQHLSEDEAVLSPAPETVEGAPAVKAESSADVDEGDVGAADRADVADAEGEETLDQWEDEVGMMVEQALPAVKRAATKSEAAKSAADLDGTVVEPARRAVLQPDRRKVVDGKLVKGSAADEERSTGDAEPGSGHGEAIDMSTLGMEPEADGEMFDDIEIADMDLEEAFAAVDRLDEMGDTQPVTVVSLDDEAVFDDEAAFDDVVRLDDMAPVDDVVRLDDLEEPVAEEPTVPDSDLAWPAAPPPPPVEDEKPAWTGLETTKIPQAELDEVAASPPPTGLATTKLAGANLLLDASAPQLPAEAALHRERLESLARKSQSGSLPVVKTERRWPVPVLLISLILLAAFGTWWVMTREAEPGTSEVIAEVPATGEPEERTAAEIDGTETGLAEPATSAPFTAEPVASEPAAAEFVASEPPPPVAQPPVSPPPQTSPPQPTAQDRARVEADLRATVERWRAAWSAQDPEAYLAIYSRAFRPADGTSRSTWANQRRERLRTPQRIDVGVENLRIEAVDNNTARVRFFQVYETEALRRATWKRFDLVREGGEWKISSEQVERGPAGGAP